MTIEPLGDSTLIVDFSDESSDPEQLLYRALSATKALEHAEIPGLNDVTSAYRSVALFFDLISVTSASGGMRVQDFLTERINRALVGGRRSNIRGREIEIPVCYEEEFALDLARVVEHTSVPSKEVVALHAAAKYRVACIGFMPGFPFLIGLPEKLRVPRLTTPRTKVPAGSVAIAIAQAGIYPFESPGGWNVIGRTPVRLFKPNLNPPAFLLPGDRIRFRPITRDRYQALVE